MILNAYGNPIRTGDLRAPQTVREEARVGWLRRAFSDHPTNGLTPAKLRRIMTDAEQHSLADQCDLADDMEEKDGHIFAELQKRRRALVGYDWSIEPPRNASDAERKQAAEIEEILLDFEALPDLVYDLTDGLLKGYAAAEITWGLAGRLRVPERAELRPQRWLTTHVDHPDELRLRDGSPEGAALTPFGWILHRPKARSGYVARAGLVRVLAWPFLFKAFSLRDLAEFLEIYGLPVRIGTYPHGADDREKATLLSAVMGIGHDAAGIIPEGMMIDFKEAAEGASDPFAAMMAWCEGTVSKAVNGGTLTTQVGSTGGNRALGEVHERAFEDLVLSDAQQLAATLTRDLVWPLHALNHGGADPRRAPRFVFDTQEPEDLKLYSEALPNLVDLGLRIPRAWAHDKLKIPEPDGDEDILARAAPAPAPGSTPPGEPGNPGEIPPVPPAPAPRKPAPPGETAAARACPSCGGAHAALAAAARAKPAEDAVPAQLARLQREGDAAVAAWVEQVRALLDEVGSLEELRERLIEIYPEMDPAQFAAAMGDALAAAHLAGRYDILTGA